MTGVDEVFIKDMACFVVSQPDYRSLLPAGYIHTFLIRHPAKAIPSFYKACTDKQFYKGGTDKDMTGECGTWPSKGLTAYETLCTPLLKKVVILIS